MADNQRSQSAPPPRMGRSSNTLEGYDTAKVYIERYLKANGFPTLDNLTYEHVEGDHLCNLLESIGHWLASTTFRTQQNTWLGNKSKSTYFKATKSVFQHIFREHELFNSDGDWWTDMMSRFKKECKRNWIEDDDVSDIRKSEPLYRDLDANKSAIRAKYAGATVIDAKTIAKSMIKKANKKSAQDLAEFNISRNGIGRGGEHSFIRWNEGTFDKLYEALDLDWSIIKQTERQCMLLFCDRSLYCLCPYFGLAVYFMFGGARRDGVSEAKKDFMFPSLHKMNKNSVAGHVTRFIQSNISDPELKKRYTSRSTRKAAMTENRMHPDLDILEEYARSGHTAPGMNSNAEGYIESTPGMNAPGGMALAGYNNCHVKPVPFSFECLGTEMKPVVDRLVAALFKVDVPELKDPEKLRPVLYICAARLIGSYTNLVREFGVENGIVKKIMQAAMDAEIDDPRVLVKSNGLFRWNEVLNDWSKKIQKAFVENNPEKVAVKSSVEDQVGALAGVIERLVSKVDELETRLDSREQDNAALELANQNNQILQQQNAEMAATIATQKREMSKLRRAVSELALSPEKEHSSPMLLANAGLADSSSVAALTLDMDVDDEAPPPPAPPQPPLPSQPTAAIINNPPSNANPAAASAQPSNTARASSTAGTTSMDTVDSSRKRKSTAEEQAAFNSKFRMASSSNDIGGIELKDELERLWNDAILEKKAQMVPDGPLPKQALYDRHHSAFVGFHPNFGENKAKYEHAMTMVAMSISNHNWNMMLEHDLDDEDSRKLCAKIQEDVMNYALQLEYQVGLKVPGTKQKGSPPKPTLSSVSLRFVSIRKKWKANLGSDLAVKNLIQEKVDGTLAPGTQTTIGYRNES